MSSRLVATAVAVVLAATVLTAPACGGSRDDYDDDVEREFLESCGVGAPVEVCECAYARIVAEVPYDRFDEVDDQLDAADPETADPDLYPDDISSIVVQCAAEHAVSAG